MIRLFLSLGSAAACVTGILALPVAADELTKIPLLTHTEDAPRRTESDFVTLRDGRLLLVYSKFTGGVRDASTAHLASRVSTLTLHDVFQWQLFAAHPITRPMGEHVGGEARVADHAAVRTTIGQAGQCSLGQVHLTDNVEIAVGKVCQWEQQQFPTISLQQQVVDHFYR